MKIVGKYVADAVLAAIKGTAFPLPANIYVAAILTAPTARDGTGIAEVSTVSTGYARQAVASTGWNAASTSGSGLTSLEQITQTALITWSAATANWGTIIGIALYDAATGGNFWGYGDLSASVIINANDTFQVPAADLAFQF